ncbi:MAG: metallophosphoesterase [Clostridia bacterium]|nr:metallophosphoesterase [Clostridia bacterium]
MKNNTTKRITAGLLTVLMILSAFCVTASAASSDAIAVTGADIRYTDTVGGTTGTQAQGLRFTVSVDKTTRTYQNAVREEGYYDAASETARFGIVIIPTDMIPDGKELTADTDDAEVVMFDRIYSQNDEELVFTVSLLGIPTEEFTREFTARAFVKVSRGGDERYTYSENTLAKTFVGVGNMFYEDNRSDESLCSRLDEIFTNCEEYQGEHIKSVTFTLFADLHYWKGWYISSVDNLESILRRADESGSDFVMQAGDFTNNVSGSPELINAYHKNQYDLPVYGVYGNHEMEQGDGMNTVTPTLTNSEVVWGTKDGKRAADGSIGYYYFDVNGIRMICLDSNYSYNPTKKVWEHNPARSYSYPKGNERGYSLGPDQLAWLERVLDEAAENDTSCVVVSHIGFATAWSSSPDATAVRELYKQANSKRAGTVLMSISGHLHTNRQEVIDGVLHWDMNTVRNGVYTDSGNEHYTDQTFTLNKYDGNGKLTSSTTQLIKNLGHAKKTWFFKDPLSAVVTVSTSGRITVEGSETEWLGGIAPSGDGTGGVEPRVTSGIFELQIYCEKKDD